MKTLIIYFSQTGNTRKIAECIRDGVMDVSNQCDLRSLNDIDGASVAEYDLVGIGSPVFYYKEPFHVRDFIKSLPDLDGQHWFIFCTHGNVIGNFFPSMIDLLKQKNGVTIGVHDSYADITVPFYPRPSYTTGHPDETDLNQARAFGTAIAKRNPQIIDPESTPIPDPMPVSSEEWILDSIRMTEDALRKIMPKLNLDKERCTQCHTCEKNCPVQGIDIEADPPQLQEPCIFCFRCVTICPAAAIQADWMPIVELAPKNYARYKKELDRATACGEFRWLINPDRINLADPLFKQREREIKHKKKKTG